METVLINHIGNTILLNLSKEFRKTNHSLIQSNNDVTLFYAKLTSVDDIGIWVENPKWETTNSITKKNNYYIVNLLIPWNALISIALFPERKFNHQDETIKNAKIIPIGNPPLSKE